MHRLILVALSLLGSGACGFSELDDARRGTVVIDTLESGVIQVRNSPPPARFDAPRWVLEEELRIGTLEDAGPDMFGDIRGIEVDDEGRLYILEYQAQEVRVFGPDGAHLFTFARKGEGPGELSGANGIAFAPDGRIWIPDMSTHRFSVFRADGSFERSYQTLFWRRGSTWCCGFGRDGYLYDDSGRHVDDQGDQHRTLRRFDDSFEHLADIPWPPMPAGYEPPVYTFTDSNGAFRGSTIVPFGAFHLASFDLRGGFHTMMADHYRIERLDLEGDTLRIIESAITPVPVIAAEREEALGRIRGFAERVGGGRVDASRIPAMKPLLLATLVDDADRLWVRTTAAGEGMTYDIFDPEGRFLGAARAVFEIPNFWRPIIRGDLFYTVVRGEFDEPYVVRARLRPRDAID